MMHNAIMFSFLVTFFLPFFFVPIQNEVKRIDFTEAFHSFAVSPHFPLHTHFAFILFKFACCIIIVFGHFKHYE